MEKHLKNKEIQLKKQEDKEMKELKSRKMKIII